MNDNLNEPRYVEDPFEDEFNPRRRPKWMIPQKPLEVRILSAVGRKYYPDKHLRSEVLRIVKASMSLDSGVESEYPTEWVEYCCEWAEGKRAKRSMVQLKGLLSFINRKEAKEEFLDKYEREYESVEDDDDDYLLYFDQED